MYLQKILEENASKDEFKDAVSNLVKSKFPGKNNFGNQKKNRGDKIVEHTPSRPGRKRKSSVVPKIRITAIRSFNTLQRGRNGTVIWIQQNFCPARRERLWRIFCSTERAISIYL